MGRVKTQLIKRNANKLIHVYNDRFKKDFNENKSIVKELTEIPSKKLRNIVTGYVTRLMKQEKKQ